jgi:hypothetical protein
MALSTASPAFQHAPPLHSNLVLSIPGFTLVRLAMLPIRLTVAMWAQDRHVGLLNWIQLPRWLAVIATLLLMGFLSVAVSSSGLGRLCCSSSSPPLKPHVQRETNSNGGTIFCWWDKLHRTLRIDIPQDEVIIGVAAFRDEHELTAGKLLALPFQKQRP